MKKTTPSKAARLRAERNKRYRAKKQESGLKRLKVEVEAWMAEEWMAQADLAEQSVNDLIRDLLRVWTLPPAHRPSFPSRVPHNLPESQKELRAVDLYLSAEEIAALHRCRSSHGEGYLCLGAVLEWIFLAQLSYPPLKDGPASFCHPRNKRWSPTLIHSRNLLDDDFDRFLARSLRRALYNRSISPSEIVDKYGPLYAYELAGYGYDPRKLVMGPEVSMTSENFEDLSPEEQDDYLWSLAGRQLREEAKDKPKNTSYLSIGYEDHERAGARMRTITRPGRREALPEYEMVHPDGTVLDPETGEWYRPKQPAPKEPFWVLAEFETAGMRETRLDRDAWEVVKVAQKRERAA